MEEIIQKLKELKRYDINPFHDGVIAEHYSDGEYVKWSDIEKIFNN